MYSFPCKSCIIKASDYITAGNAHELVNAVKLMVLVAQSCPTLRRQGLKLTKLLCSWNPPGKNTGVGSHSLLQGIFSTQGSNLHLLCCRQTLYCLSHYKGKVKLLSPVQLFAIPWTVGNQASPSMGFSRQEYWSGLPFPSPVDLLNPGVKPASPALHEDSLPSELPGKPLLIQIQMGFNIAIMTLKLWGPEYHRKIILVII